MKEYSNAELEPQKKSMPRWCAWGMSLITLSLMAFAPFAQADEGEDIPELPSIEVRPLLSMPVPVKTVKPLLPESLLGTEIRMTFKLGKDGKPYEIRYPWTPDLNQGTLGATMQQKLKHWKFKPAKDLNGNAIATRLALPVKVVSNGNGNADRYAAVTYSDPVLLAVLDK